MATLPIGKGASVASNVVRLPTAAPRKVDNNRYSAQRAPKIALRKETAHRFNYQHPGTRAAADDAATYLETNLTPALLIVAAMFKHMPPEAQEEVMRSVDLYTLRGSKAHAQAMLAMKMSRPMTVGACMDFANALSAISSRKVGVVEVEGGQ